MNIDDLSEHVAQVRLDLETKKRDLPGLLFTDPEAAMQIRFAIDCLEPRLRELERSCRRLTNEESARLSSAFLT